MPFTPRSQLAHRASVRGASPDLAASAGLHRPRRDRCVMAQAAVATKEKTATTNTAAPEAPFDVSRTILLQGECLSRMAVTRSQPPFRLLALTASTARDLNRNSRLPPPPAPELLSSFLFKRPQHLTQPFMQTDRLSSLSYAKLLMNAVDYVALIGPFEAAALRPRLGPHHCCHWRHVTENPQATRWLGLLCAMI